MTKVLLTGGSGFIAAHILDQLLSASHTVITTVRSQSKADAITSAYPSQTTSGHLTVAIVPDIAQPNAFDSVLQTHGSGLEVVLHTASPFHFKFNDPKKELIDPALIGTTSILSAITQFAPSVRRVVVTSSFAAIINEAHVSDPSTVFSEKSWNPVTIDDIHRNPATAYRASKTLAEKAAWEFVQNKENDAKFDLVTINPPMVFGPVVHHLATLEAINTSNERIVDAIKGKWKGEIPPTGQAYIWVDVRDVATAHVRAGLGLVEGVAGKRLFVVSGWFSNARIAEVLRKNFPDDKEKLPEEGVKGGELPEEDKRFKYDNSETTRLLGIEWIGLERSIVDTVRSLKRVEFSA
ncbi:methylglyoxal reductase (NADPH-dependent) gre2 [Podospora pseudoanserina]|uniref:Methylglyoxal reductase (NADPH-dependent) gre2 n=1 Tax=Podospora pseudoanserina TaxID=2609844 RepID=A0ABR0IDR2_9PEZI|nr:methylglyoxal reductase (NADPH-dependent) gre2 [Podospora pseudoanserina]